VREASTSYRRRVLALHGLGLTLGGLVSGLVLVLANAAVHGAGLAGSDVTRYVLIVLGVGWALSALGAPGLPFPRRRWQVPEQWRFTMPLDVTLVSYGVLLGVGFLTDVVLPAFWMLVLVCTFLASPAVIVPAWLLYAGTRFGALRLWLRSSREDSLESRFVGWRPLAAGANALVLLTLSAWVFFSSKGGI
jgi:hypothetical protein